MPSRFTFAGGRAVKKTNSMAALPKLSGGDDRVGFGATERAQAFVNVKYFHVAICRSD